MSPGLLFVTGSTGYIGGILIELAVADGHKDGDMKLSALGPEPVRGVLNSLDVLRNESKEADAVVNLATAYVFSQGKYEDALLIDNAAVDAMCDGLVGTNKPLITTSGTFSAQADPNGNETNEDAPPEPSHLNAKGRGIRVMAVRMAPFTYGRGGSSIARFMGMSNNMGGLPIVNSKRVRLAMCSMLDRKPGTLFDAVNSSVCVTNKDITYDEAFAGFGENIAWFLKVENRASGAKAPKKLGWQPKGTPILEYIKSGSYSTKTKVIQEFLSKKQA
ncbi:hypothetical protein T440DRAFT_502856 [Plenodomus tracheiphilus IPT5]|uniref:NAD-dependent epimerase/dehydratase domain-containing protein n=1 Tax=Plenodomus tracheiphilus IPT5 TaxID=1408161 RepID=A0A6A7ARN9_9PLEO|nr:hypothetical protein T440DRAFT_502856 [Plenodomus tracheiphilus IPT5]